MITPWSGLSREFEIVASDGVRFSRALIGMITVTREQLEAMAELCKVEARVRWIFFALPVQWDLRLEDLAMTKSKRKGELDVTC